MISLTSLANFNSAVPWGLWVAVYVWFIGISAGAYFITMRGCACSSTSLTTGGKLDLKKVAGISISLSLATLCAGLLSILVDLGHMERFYKLFINPAPSSVMAWMVWLYNLYFVVLLVALFRLKHGIAKSYACLTAVFALGILFAESLLFALPPGSSWHAWAFPVHFVIGSIASGAAALIFLLGILSRGGSQYDDTIKALSKVLILLLLVNLMVGVVESGKFTAPMLLAAFAVVLLFRPSMFVKRTAALAALAVAFWEKYISLVSAQAAQPFKGFAAAYVESKSIFAYAPSIGEWAVALFLGASAIVIFIFLYRTILPRLNALPVKEVE